MSISVIVPIYKVEKYLRKCVDSIINQTYKDLEIWLVDDGSPDGCPEICDEYAKKDSRIKVIHKENGGLSDARNAALDRMTGEYVTFVDSDDYIEPDAVEYMYNALTENNAQIAVGNMVGFNETEDLGYVFPPFDNEIVLKNEDVLKLVNQPSGPNKLYKSELFNNVRFPKGKLYEDLHIWHKILQSVDAIVMTGTTVYHYLIRQGSIMQSKYTVRSADRFEPLKERADWLEGLGRYDLADENRLFIYSDFADATAHKDLFCDENNKRFEEIKEIYIDSFEKLKHSKNIELKQKIRLYLLAYLPEIHTKLYKNN